MSITILSLAAPIAGMGAMFGLWHKPTMPARDMWRAVAIATSLLSTAAMAILAMPLDALVNGAPPTTITVVLFALGLWTGLAALLGDEYRSTQQTRPRSLLFGIGSAITASRTLDDMLMSAASAFRSDANADCAHVFKISHKRARAILTGSSSAESISSPDTSHNCGYLAELAWWAAQESSIVRAEDLFASPVISIPIANGRHTYAVIMVNNPQSRIRETQIMEWTAAAAILGNAVADWSMRAAYERSGMLADRLPRCADMLAECCDLEAALPAIETAIAGIIDYDYLAITWLGNSRTHEDRASMLRSNSRIIESRRGWPISGDVNCRVLATGSAIITPDLEMADESDESQSWERRLGMRSRLTTPILHHERTIGTITIADSHYAKYDTADMELLGLVSALLAARLAELTNEREIIRLHDLNASASSPATAAPIADQLKTWSRSVVNPLTAIIGSAELVRRKQKDFVPDAAKYLGTIEKSAARIHEELMAMIEHTATESEQAQEMTERGRWTYTRPAEVASVPDAPFRRPISVGSINLAPIDAENKSKELEAVS